MSKALNTILTVGSLAALAVATAGAGLAVAGGFSIGAGIGSVAGAIGISSSLLVGAALSGLSYLVGGGGGTASKPETTETSIKTERPPRVRALGESRLYGASICYETVNGTTVDVWAHHDGRAHAILRTYLNDNQVTVVGGVVQALPDKSYQGGHVKLGYSMGSPTETAFPAVTALLPTWDADHRGDGVVCGYLLKEPEKAKYFLETYPQGDNVTLSLVGQWTPKYDPRDAAQDPYDESTWGWSDNAVLAFVWYLMVERGYDWNTRFAPQLDKLIAAIDIADEDVPLAGGGTEKRYRTALSYKETEEPANIITSLLACFDGWYCLNERGEVIVYAGAYYEPTVTIDARTITNWRQPMGVEAENRINQIAIPYVSKLHDYGTVDGEAWRDEESISAIGRENDAELGAVVPSHTQGRRLAKIKMARANAADRGTVTTTYGGRGALEQRFINLRIEEAGALFFDGVAEIVGAERDPNTGGVTFDWVAADSNAWTWNPATEDGEGAPVGNRVAPAPLDQPTVVSVTPTYGQNSGYDTPGVKLTIVVNGPDRDGLTWYVRTRFVGQTSWLEQEYPDIDPGASVTLETDFLPLGEIEAEVSYAASDGRVSPWAALGDGSIDTGGQLPAGITNLSVSSNADGTLIVADWDDAQFATSYLVELIVEPAP